MDLGRDEIDEMLRRSAEIRSKLRRTTRELYQLASGSSPRGNRTRKRATSAVRVMTIDLDDPVCRGRMRAPQMLETARKPHRKDQELCRVIEDLRKLIF